MPYIPFEKFNAQEFLAEVASVIEQFPEATQKMLHEALKYVMNDRDVRHVQEWLFNPHIWRMPRVSMDTFLDSPHYLGIGKQVYPKVREICRELIEGNYREGVEVAGIGCERVGTKIIMADGSIKSNEDLKVGDFVMGRDGKPRKILEIHTGIDDMYELIPVKGEKKYITKEHRLFGVWTSRGKMYSGSRQYIGIDNRGNTEEAIAVKDYLTLSEKNKKLFKLLYSDGIDFSEKDTILPPYMMGLWLGDGTTCRAEITSIDQEVIDYVYDYAESIGARITQNKDSYKITFGNQRKKESVPKKYFSEVLDKKYIPENYLKNSRKNRLELLAGLVDTDGTNAGNYFEFYNSNEELIDQVAYLARSLGFVVKKSENNKMLNGKKFNSWRISIVGDCSIIPTKIERKKCYTRKQKKDHRRTGIKELNYVGKEKYIGLKIDGDELYLWEDFMVTHNSGKSFSSEILACYAAHHLLCLQDPHKYYGLSADKPIAIMNMGINATQALEVVFTGIKSFIEVTPFFQQFMPTIMSASVRFERQKILLTSGNSKATTPLGYNIFYAILDEAAFYLDNDNHSVAQEIYESLQRRIVSRFGNDGLIMMISSPRYVEDFIMKKITEANELWNNGKRKYPHIFTIQLPTWKVKGLARASIKDKFYFHVRQSKILDMTESEVIAEGYNINYIDTDGFDETFDVWEIPGEYKASFQQNPEKAKRDFGATPSEVLAGYFPNPQVINDMWNKTRKNPVIGPGQYKFTERPERISYYIHVDIGFNRNGAGDHTGFAMGHFGGWEYDEGLKEWRMKFVIDLVERIGILGRTGEIDLADVRKRIYDLKAMGFHIALVTFDSFASKDFRQTIEKRGFRTDYVSVDKNTGPYDILKEAIYENRLDCPYDEVLSKELKQLELIKGAKVDHPPYGSKDVADAVAGVMFNIVENTPKTTMKMGIAANTQPTSLKMQQHLEEKRKTDEYNMKKRIVQRQMELENRIHGKI